jgi:hypothetical protein
VSIAHDVPTVAETLDDLLAEPPEPVHGSVLDHLRSELEETAAAAVEVVTGAGAADRFPLRLPKGRLLDLQRCERLTVERAALAVPSVPTVPMLLGAALDRYVLHELTVGPVGDPVEDLLALLDAQGEFGLADDLLALGDDVLGRLAPLASAARAWTGIEPGWWPRTQTPAVLQLAGGRVVSEGVVDVELGGPLSGRPGLVVEVKSGRPGHDHLAEVTHYALLAALRDRCAPGWVLRWYPGTAPAVMPVSVGTLDAAARRLGDQMTRWAALCSGTAATERGGVWCGWCPVADGCSSAIAQRGPLDDLADAWEPEADWDDDD